MNRSLPDGDHVQRMKRVIKNRWKNRNKMSRISKYLKNANNLVLRGLRIC